MTDMEIEEQINNLRLELRRGIVVLAVLSQMDTARYGYSLIQRLAAQGLDVEEGTLYPLLRRLEKQGLLTSEWNTEESRPRKFYRVSRAGDALLQSLLEEWQALHTSIQNLAENPR